MKKIAILSCTNRHDSYTIRVSRIYEGILRSKSLDVEVLDFMDLPGNIATEEIFGKRSNEYSKLISHYITGNQKFFFIVPEYNGSFPGILKLFIDTTNPRDWSGKDACLVGVSDGRAGNLRGLDHLTGILQYLKMNVYHNKLPISVIGKVMDKEGAFSNPDQMNACINQVEGFLGI